MNNPSFVHLDVNTEYSLGRSIIRRDALIEACIEMDMPAFGVTERNNLFSAYKLFKTSQNVSYTHLTLPTIILE